MKDHCIHSDATRPPAEHAGRALRRAPPERRITWRSRAQDVSESWRRRQSRVPAVGPTSCRWRSAAPAAKASRYRHRPRIRQRALLITVAALVPQGRVAMPARSEEHRDCGSLPSARQNTAHPQEAAGALLHTVRPSIRAMVSGRLRWPSPSRGRSKLWAVPCDQCTDGITETSSENPPVTPMSAPSWPLPVEVASAAVLVVFVVVVEGARG